MCEDDDSDEFEQDPASIATATNRSKPSMAFPSAVGTARQGFQRPGGRASGVADPAVGGRRTYWRRRCIGTPPRRSAALDAG